MLRSILSAWRPVALAAAVLALAAAPACVQAAGHAGGYHGGGYHGGGYHASGYHGGSYHSGGYHTSGYRPSYFSGYHNGYGDHRSYGYHGGYYSPWLYGSPAYISGGYDVGPDYYSPGYSTTSQDYSPSAYYTPEATAPTPAVTALTAAPDATPGPATVDVHVPASAQVWLDDSLTQQTGDWRRFQSPPLTVGKDYQYAARARWTENGRAMEQTRIFAVHAYEVSVVDFTVPAPAVSASK
jgi:uncharacterized protein (TIGR03000 family)